MNALKVDAVRDRMGNMLSGCGNGRIPEAAQPAS